MPSWLEKEILLTGGPPWGFRLQEQHNGFTIYQVRRQSPADFAGIKEGNTLISVNNISINNMSLQKVMRIIETAHYLLNLRICRQEDYQPESYQVNNFTYQQPIYKQQIYPNDKLIYLQNYQQQNLSRNNYDDHYSNNYFSVPQPVHPKHKYSTTVRTILMRPPKNDPVPYSSLPIVEPEPQIYQDFSHLQAEVPQMDWDPNDVMIIPASPDVEPIPMKKLMTPAPAEVPEPKITRKTYADSAFYNDPTKCYPTVEEQKKMAKLIADSFKSADNLGSKGQQMFKKRRLKMNVEMDEENETTSNLTQSVSQASLPVYDIDNKCYSIPQAPSLPLHGFPKTVQEFVEEALKRLPKTMHDTVPPEQCFKISAALHNSTCKGAQIFSKRREKSSKWEITSLQGEDLDVRLVTEGGNVSVKPVSSRRKKMDGTVRVSALGKRATQPVKNAGKQNVTSNLIPQRATTPNKNKENIQQGPYRAGSVTSTAMVPSLTISDNQYNDFTTKPTASFTDMKNRERQSWRPVKFNVPSKVIC